MYYRPRFLEELHAIREEMSRTSDYDMDRFANSLSIRNNFPAFPIPENEKTNSSLPKVRGKTKKRNST